MASHYETDSTGRQGRILHTQKWLIPAVWLPLPNSISSDRSSRRFSAKLSHAETGRRGVPQDLAMIFIAAVKTYETH
jgi:hypothetical protein